MPPFEALYGRPCRTLLSWSESGEMVIFGLNIVTKAEEKVKQIRANILTAQFCQKSYTNKRRRPLEFEVGEHVYLRVSPVKGVHRFAIKGKLAILSSAAILEAIESSQCVPHLPTQKMSEAPD
jgi:hypothetical protein